VHVAVHKPNDNQWLGEGYGCMLIALFIVGDDLDPERVSAVLGGPPHVAGKKGDAVTHTTAKGKTISRPAIAGYWRREVSLPTPQTLDSAVRLLLAGLAVDSDTWRFLSSSFRVGISVMEAPPGSTPESIFPASTLALMKERNWEVSIIQD
jgi:hypothetical protein